MIGKTNSQTGGALRGEKLNISLTSNQSSHSDLIGAVITITHAGGTTEHVWGGSEFTVEVPPYVEYSVEYGKVEGYATPAKFTATAVKDNARTLTAEYKSEFVSVTLSSDNGEDVIGQVVTINGVQYTWLGEAIAAKIPFGVNYSISVNEKEDFILPSSLSFTASQQSRAVDMQYVYDPYIDLSMRDIYGNTVDQNTANCYVIKEAGKYMFPIAYGAAIKNGAVNTPAFTGQGGAYSIGFRNFKNVIISSPYVETDTSTQAESVQMSIADMENAVSNLQIVDGSECRYVRFTVGSVPSVGANAVISVKDASGTIMWNWHIWLWSDDLSEEEITNSSNVKYKILPVNLGSKWDSGKTRIKNWYYQFGRPVPLLCSSTYNSATDHASFGALTASISSAASNINEGITKPTTIYKAESAWIKNWFINPYGVYDLWDAACKTVGLFDNDTVKTVYDPCPAGWKVPNGNTFTGFEIIRRTYSTIMMRRYVGDTTGVGVPLSGHRYYETGAISSIDTVGNLWTSASQSEQYSYYFYVDSGHNVHKPTYSVRSYGMPVRPVKDADLAIPKHKLTINVSGDTSTPSGYEIKVCQVVDVIDESTGQITETIGDEIFTQTSANETHELVWGTKYAIVAGEADGFVSPQTQIFVADQLARTVNLVYIASALKVNILSNQSSGNSWDPTIANIKATVSYGSTTLQVSNGQQINIPTNQEVTITFPSVTGYKTPDTIKFTNTNGGVVEKTGTYQTQLLTVNVTYSGTAPSGYTITGKDSGGNVLFTQAVAFATHKIPYGTSYTVSASKLDGYNAVADQSGVANSTSNTITMMYVHNPFYDLSKHDIYGNPINQTTANCYVIRKAGNYMFPIAYGAAIKNGAVNAEAYTKNSGRESQDFLNYKGNIISSPYIETDTGEQAVSAQMSIADMDNAVTELSVENGTDGRYVFFKVNEVPSVGANAVISVKDASGTIMWNWHIWLWSDDLTAVEITNATSVKYEIMPIPLGFKWDGNDKSTGKAWFYQWGRPTPLLCHAAYNSNTAHQSFGALSFGIESTASGIDVGIQNPTTFFCGETSYGFWFSPAYYSYNMWDAACTAVGNSDNDVVKTVYDPSPVGFKMPNGNTFTGFSLASICGRIHVNVKRYSGDTVYYKLYLSGYLEWSNGRRDGSGDSANVWLSSSKSGEETYYMTAGVNGVYKAQGSYKRSAGFNIIPVKG